MDPKPITSEEYSGAHMAASKIVEAVTIALSKPLTPAQELDLYRALVGPTLHAHDAIYGAMTDYVANAKGWHRA